MQPFRPHIGPRDGTGWEARAGGGSDVWRENKRMDGRKIYLDAGRAPGKRTLYAPL